ncbi:hypothetical protein OL548_01815 [Lysinibacillus sp. MHQ-1]|nr:hypothetical protein OL548_01815 [Lysinibacillus sp. MHQ-1]
MNKLHQLKKDGKEEKEDKEAVGADVEYQEFQTSYPVLNWAQLANEKVVQESGMERVILTFEGEKSLYSYAAASDKGKLYATSIFTR